MHHEAPQVRAHTTPRPMERHFLDMNSVAVRAPAPRVATRIAGTAMIAALVACGDSTGTGDNNYDIEFDFSNDYQGWVAGFADYPVGKETEWAIGASLAPLPAPLDASRKGILLTGMNHSDDLFMYVTRGITALTPNKTYALRFRVTLATNAPKNCVGVGGAPGESVVLKVGGTSTEPARVVDAAEYYRANSNTNCLTPRYELKQYDSGTMSLTVNADASGRVWLVVGIDSGFEGTTSV